jgi:hypothetical protein
MYSETEHLITDGSARPEDIRFEHQFGPCGIENLLGGAGSSPVNLKVLVHDQEDIEISGRRLRGDKTTPDEDAAELACLSDKAHQGPKAPEKPKASRRRTAKPGFELVPIRRVNAGRQFPGSGGFGQHSPTITNGLSLIFRDARRSGVQTKARLAVLIPGR